MIAKRFAALQQNRTTMRPAAARRYGVSGRGDGVLGALRDLPRLRTEVLAGLVVALALIPEAIAFSVIAGVDPRVGLFSWRRLWR